MAGTVDELKRTWRERAADMAAMIDATRRASGEVDVARMGGLGALKRCINEIDNVTETPLDAAIRRHAARLAAILDLAVECRVLTLRDIVDASKLVGVAVDIGAQVDGKLLVDLRDALARLSQAEAAAVDRNRNLTIGSMS